MIYAHTKRHGISLMEVLISMGILTIGLVSVISLVPAGRSQAVKASALDRSTALAQNAAADFINRGFLRPTAWMTSPDGSTVAVFDPLDASNFWDGSLSLSLIAPRIDAATTASGTTAITAAGPAVVDIVIRGEDDVRYSTDNVADDDPPRALWSASGMSGRHVFEGGYSYLATLSGSTNTWRPGEYKTLTVVTMNRRDPTLQPITLSLSDTTSGIWNVASTYVPSGSALKDIIKPGAMVLSYSGTATPIYSWQRVLMAADATNPAAPTVWRVSLTCEGGGLDTTNVSNRIYVFPGANGSLQMPVRLEGTSPWND